MSKTEQEKKEQAAKAAKAAAEVKQAEEAQAKLAAEGRADGNKAGTELAAASGEAGKDTRNFFTKMIDGVKGIFSGGKKDENGQEVEEKDENGNPKKKSGIGEWFKSLNVGGLTGGILGVMGAWFVGSTFGGGIVGTIASALLSLGGFFIGQKFGNKTINSWLDRDETGKPIEKGQVQQVVQQGVAPQGQTKTQTVQSTLTPLTNEELLAVKEQFRQEMRQYKDSPNPRFHAADVQGVPSSPTYAPDARNNNVGRVQQ